MQRGGDTYYYHFDGLGSVTALTNSSGETVESYSYDVYGKPSTTSTIGNPYMFTAREYDSETGLYYYRARMYSPELGRFLQTDPIGYWGGINLYTYCNNDPINWIDPWGLCKDKNKGIFPEGYIYGPDGKPIGPTGPVSPIPLPPDPNIPIEPNGLIPKGPTPTEPNKGPTRVNIIGDKVLIPGTKEFFESQKYKRARYIVEQAYKNVRRYNMPWDPPDRKREIKSLNDIFYMIMCERGVVS